MFKKFFLIFLSLIILGFNFYTIYPQIRQEISIIRRNLWADYDWKMEEKIGGNFYKYVKFLQKEIPREATVLIPPQSFPWPQTGNRLYLNYFLYPRKLINWDESKLLKTDYILVLWGESEPTEGYAPGFPKTDIAGEYIFFQNDDFSKVYKKDQFIFKNDMKNGVWGVIKIKKD